jgi:Tfp pilus assembly protein FimT
MRRGSTADAPLLAQAHGRSVLRRTSASGWSVLEMLAVLAIMGIMVAAASPSFLNFFHAMKVRTAAQRLQSQVRLCRQVAVSRRSEVTLKVEGNEAASTYSAWEDKVLDQVRDANGADNVVNNDDDERWVVRPDNQLEQDHVKLVDCFNDITPADPDDDPGNSIMEDNALILRFYPNGQVLRVDAEDVVINDDTLVRMRLEGIVGNTQIDRWEVAVNRAGKVQTDFRRLATDE